MGNTSDKESVTLKTGLSDRLKSIREYLGKSQTDMDHLLGLGKKSWQRNESGGHLPGSKALATLANKGFNINWLLSGEGLMLLAPESHAAHEEMVRDVFLGNAEAGAARRHRLKHVAAIVNAAEQQGAAQALGSEFALVPRLPVEAAAGAGSAVDNESEIGKLAFRRDWLRNKGLSAADLAVIRIKGDSMAPTIRDGALALVDCRRHQEKPKSDGIYVIRMDGDLIAKRVQIDLAGGGLYIKSDNPAYTEQCLTAEQADRLFIVGRVIWVGGEI